MDVDRKRWLISLFRWDARAILALSLALVILISLALAATDLNQVVAFDFGGASLVDKASGMVQVKGSLSIHPKKSGNITYGWVSTGISEFSDKSVADLIKRDYNTGPAGAIFRIDGLEQGNYNFKATVGSSDGALSTRMKIGDSATSVTVQGGNWKTAALLARVDNGTVDLVFESANGIDPWGICGLAVYLATGDVSQPTFTITVTPVEQTIPAGSATRFTVGFTPIDNYSSAVEVKIGGLVEGITAEFVPAQLNTLPGITSLTIYTTKQVPPANYSLLVTAIGKDTAVTKQTVSFRLVVNSETTTTVGEAPILPVRSSQEVNSDFSKLDAFVLEEKKKVVSKNNLQEIKGVGDDLSNVPIYEGLPKPKTTTEAILQKLVTAGIISLVTNSAPVVQEAPKPIGFWQGLWQSIFRAAT